MISKETFPKNLIQILKKKSVGIKRGGRHNFLCSRVYHKEVHRGTDVSNFLCHSYSIAESEIKSYHFFDKNSKILI